MGNARNLARVLADTSGAIAATNLANAVPADGSITNAKIVSVAASKLSGRVLSPNANSNGIVQVLSTSATGEISTASSSWSNSGLQITITPSTTSSRILIQGSLNYRCDGGATKQWAGTIFRDGTNLNSNGYIASAVGNGAEGTACFNFVDSPSTTSAITYYIKFSNPDGLTSRVNPTCCSQGTKYSYMTVMEIAP